MADVHPLFSPDQVDQACAAFHRHGFAVIGAQPAYARVGTW